MKKFLSTVLLSLMLLSFWPNSARAGAIDLAVSFLAKTLNEGEYTSYPLAAKPGDTVLLYYNVTNVGGAVAEGLQVDFSPLTRGLSYPSPDYQEHEPTHYNQNNPQTIPTSDLDLDLDGTDGGDNSYLMGDLPIAGFDELQYLSFKIPADFSEDVITLTATPSCITGCQMVGNSNTITVNVNNSPQLTNAFFSPNSILNNGVDTTVLTVEVSDPNGLSDIAAVQADLSTLGLAADFQLYDDGAHQDGAIGDGKFGATNIFTTVSAGNYSIPVLAKDNAGHEKTINASLIVQQTNTPIVRINSLNRNVLSTLYPQAILRWKSSQDCGTAANQGYRIERGGNGTPLSGTQIYDWNTNCVANTEVSVLMNTSALENGNNTFYLYVVNNNGTGYQTFNLELDNESPQVRIGSYPATLNTNDAFINWKANENGN